MFGHRAGWLRRRASPCRAWLVGVVLHCRVYGLPSVHHADGNHQRWVRCRFSASNEAVARRSPTSTLLKNASHPADCCRASARSAEAHAHIPPVHPPSTEPAAPMHRPLVPASVRHWAVNAKRARSGTVQADHRPNSPNATTRPWIPVRWRVRPSPERPREAGTLAEPSRINRCSARGEKPP